MKSLLLCSLIIFFGCGHDHQPRAVDYQDSDGDQLPNYQETSLEKYVANFEPLNSVKGTAHFFENGLQEITFENQTFANDIQLLLTGSERLLPKTPYFSEWSEAQIRSNSPSLDPGKNYQVSLNFQTGSDLPDELSLENTQRSLSLGRCGMSCLINLSGRDLQSWLSGELTLMFKKKFRHARFYPKDASTTIQTETYRVRIGRNKKVETLYVSRKLKIEELLRLKGMSGCIDLNAIDLFTAKQSDKKECFIRKLRKGDYVIGEETISDVKKSFLSLNFSSEKMVMTRENGVTSSRPIKLKNTPGARIYVMVTEILRTTQTFREERLSRTYSYGGGALNGNGPDKYSCTHLVRSTDRSLTEELDVYAFLENVLWMKDGKSFGVTLVDIFNLDQIFEGNQVIWGMKIDARDANLELTLPSRSASTYVTTGEYAHQCEKGYPERSLKSSALTNAERKLSFTVETFVENL